MIKTTFGLTQQPFCREKPALLPQQAEIIEMLKVHAQHGGFSVIVGQPGVGKSVIREQIESWRGRETLVAAMTQTLHTYMPMLKQLALSVELEASVNKLEAELIKLMYQQAQQQKTLYTVIDEAHLLDLTVLRKLRLLFERFPKKHNLILLGQEELLYRLSLNCHADIKSRISYSTRLLPLNDDALQAFILKELSTVGLGANVFDEAALAIILRSVRGNLRLCCTLCYGSLLAACRDNQRIVTPQHVNAVLVQPHWRSHEALIKQQAQEDAA